MATIYLILTVNIDFALSIIWDKVFKNRPSKLCGRQPLKNLKGYGKLKQTIPFKVFKGCFSQILLGSFLNTLLHMSGGLLGLQARLGSTSIDQIFLTKKMQFTI